MTTARRVILHIDMDAFYASVEQRDNAALRGKPVIVGGHHSRGVVLAASYEVRPFGVRSAMPMAQAIKRAPHAIVVQPRFHAYSEASDAFLELCASYTPLVEPLSLDEAFLDVTASQTLFGNGAHIAQSLRQRIHATLGLTASVGIADVKFAAKIASDLAKPNGQREVPAGATKDFLAPLPVSRLWGVGEKTRVILERHGLRTIGDIAARPADWLKARLGNWAEHLWELSHGIDARPVIPDRETKSIGSQETFDEDLIGADALTPHLHSHALRVARRLRKAGLVARVVHVVVKYSNFSSVTRQVTLNTPTNDGQTLYREATSLLNSIDVTVPVRLTGVSAQGLTADANQMPLFEETASLRQNKLNSAIDAIAQKFGNSTVQPADVLETRGARIKLGRT